MGDFFEPDVETIDPRVIQLLTGKQSDVQRRLSKRLYELLGGSTGKDFLYGRPEDAEEWYEKGVLAPALRSFDQEIAPRIKAGFAQHGASFGNKRAETLAGALGDVHAQATSELAKMQLSSLLAAKQRQLSLLGLGLSPTRSGMQAQAYSTPGLGSQLAGLGGTMLGAGMFGMPAGPAGLAAGQTGTGIFGTLGK